MIPTYNQSRYLQRAIESALQQTYTNIEILIGDDHSTDCTPQVVSSILQDKLDSRISYRRNTSNLGILRNYHETLLRSTGDLVVNLDGDDFFVNKTFIQDSVNLFLRNPRVVLVFGDYTEYRESSGHSTHILNRSIPHIFDDKTFFSFFARGLITWNHNTIIYKRSPAVKLGFYWHPTIPRNDWESFLRLIVGNYVAYLPGVQSAWVQHAQNETKRSDPKKYLLNYKLIDEVCSFSKTTFSHEFLSAWRAEMFCLKTNSSIIGFLNNRDYSGLVSFLQTIRTIDPSLLVKSIIRPSFALRLILSVFPFCRVRVKSIYRIAITRLKM